MIVIITIVMRRAPTPLFPLIWNSDRPCYLQYIQLNCLVAVASKEGPP